MTAHPAHELVGRDIDGEDRLRVRIAWAYYIEGLTQSEIAAQFGLNRVRVNRILSAAREEGMVQISINSPAAPFVALERSLEKQYQLQRAIVVPTPSSADAVHVSLAAAAGAHLSRLLDDNRSVGIGWGRTLRLSIQSVRRRSLTALSVVALIGGLTRASVMNAYETALHLADLHGADCFYIAAPAFADNEETRDILRGQMMIRDVLARAEKLDCALVSVGGLGPDSTMERLGLVSSADRKSLAAAGAVGDLLGHFIDADGVPVDHPLNHRVIAVDPKTLRDLPHVILASGGREKTEAVRAALRGGYVDVLITDDVTAAWLLDNG
jgi:DNA-binding transcriptional regulator LsrR (DeoR family)